MADLAALTSIAGLVEFARKAIIEYDGRWQAARGQPWKELLTGLELLENLTRTHVEAINKVVAPIEQGEILNTCKYYRDLINDPTFPGGYDRVHGIIASAKQLPQFREGEIHNQLMAVRNELVEFQQVVFVLKYNSYDLADVFDKARDLWSQMASPAQPQPEPQLDQVKAEVGHAFQRASKSLKPNGDSTEPMVTFPLNTSDDVVRLLRTWCRSWQRRSQEVLYGQHGINYAIGRVRMLAPRIE